MVYLRRIEPKLAAHAIHRTAEDVMDEMRHLYLVPERKPRFFVKVKDGENFNRRNTRRILRIKI
ncbi:MAG: hypothetical protein ACQETR_11910 [Thermodesulfobacteriota bacterium]